MNGALPESLLLPSRVPIAVEAYRRRFIAPSTNVAVAGPDAYVNIYPDTSTPGAFIDTKSTYFMMDVEIKNSNFMIDYANWGVEGVGGALWQDFKVHNQGSILEEINEYGTVASAMATLEAGYQQPITMYFSNRLKHGYVGSKHVNLIKPPMCDENGNIMFGLNPFSLGLGTAASAPGGGVVCSLSSNERLTGTSTHNFGFYHRTDLEFGGASTAVLPTTIYGGATPADWPDLYSPCESEVVRAKYIREFGSVNKAQLMTNLCNVKCFPIGMSPGSNCYSAAGDYGNLAAVKALLAAPTISTTPGTAAAPVRRPCKFRICYQPISGIIGKLATKMLATTLLAPQQMYFSIHLASPGVALNLSSDPCRRISGTIRDYVRNIGQGNKSSWGYSNFTLEAGATIAEYHLGTALGRSEIATSSLAPFYMEMGIPLAATVATDSTKAGSKLNSIYTAGVSTGGKLNTGQQVVFPPQYILTKTPWVYKPISEADINNPIIHYAACNEVFYGTCLPESVPQSQRIFQFSDTAGGVTSQMGDTTGSFQNNGTSVTYEISNIALVGDQIILPNEVTDLVIRDAMTGNFSVSTRSIRTYQVPVARSSTQSLIIPAKISICQQLLLVFQNSEQRSGSVGYYYDSNCGFNPYASLSAAAGSKNISYQGYNSTAPSLINADTGKITLYGVGQTLPLAYTPITLQPGDRSFQLRVGNNFYPPQPISTMQEMAAELVKSMRGWGDPNYSPDFFGPISQAIGLNGVLSAEPAYDCLTSGTFCTAFVPANLLDDQTIINNPDMNPLYTVGGVFLNSPHLTGTSNGANFQCPRGYCVNNMFVTPSGRFIQGINLTRFIDGDTTSGTYLGNNTITAVMTGAHALAVGDWRCIVIAMHEAKMTYLSGGQIMWTT